MRRKKNLWKWEGSENGERRPKPRSERAETLRLRERRRLASLSLSLFEVCFYVALLSHCTLRFDRLSLSLFLSHTQHTNSLSLTHILTHIHTHTYTPILSLSLNRLQLHLVKCSRCVSVREKCDVESRCSALFKKNLRLDLLQKSYQVGHSESLLIVWNLCEI